MRITRMRIPCLCVVANVIETNSFRDDFNKEKSGELKRDSKEQIARRFAKERKQKTVVCQNVDGSILKTLTVRVVFASLGNKSAS